MPGKSPVLAIKIVSDATGASKGFAEAEKRTGGFQSALTKASAGMAVAGGALLVLGKQALDAASDLQQSSGAIESVFGASSKAIAAQADKAAQSVGLSKNAYQELATVMGSQLKNMGISTDQLVPKTTKLIGLGADLAATYGGTTADAVEALSSLLRGETDPIERYGVSIKAADIKARLAAEGQDKLEGAALKAATAQAVLGLISGQTGSSLGAFAREADTAAGQSQRASASWENAKASLGESLLPVVTVVAEKLAELTGWMGDNAGTVQTLAIAFGILTVATWLLNTAMYANPVTLIALAIGATILAVGILWAKFEGFRDFVSGAFTVILWPFERLWDLVTWIWDKLSRFGDFVAGSLFGIGPDAAPAVAGAAAAGGPAVFGAAAGAPLASVAVRGAASGGGVTFRSGAAAGTSSAGTGNTYVTITGALDPVAVGRQVARVQRQYGRAVATTTVGRAGPR
jgi:hypothetical protein